MLSTSKIQEITNPFIAACGTHFEQAQVLEFKGSSADDPDFDETPDEKDQIVRKINTGYVPRPLQDLLHSQLKRFNVLVCHRRFGKTIFAICEMIDRGMRNEKYKPRYAYIAPTYKQAKRIAWEYLKDYTKELPSVEINKSDLTISIHREALYDQEGTCLREADHIEFILLGADNPDSIRGIYLDGAVLDEYAQCDPIIWGQIIRLCLADRKGWAIFIGTPKGKNHFHNRYKKALKNPRWFTAIYRASQTGILDEEEIEDMKEDLDEAEIQQELECSFTAAILGSYYGTIINDMYKQQRIRDVPYDPNLPVDTFWDLGIGDALAICFVQRSMGEVRYIDYYEASGENLPHYAKLIQSKPYLYGRHVLPHDAKARSLETGLTRQEALRKLGLICEVQTRQAVDDRIQASRARLAISYMDKTKCERLIDCLSNYQKEWDGKMFKFKTKPKHDWTSNGADAFGYSALDARKSEFANERGKNLPLFANSDYNELLAR